MYRCCRVNYDLQMKKWIIVKVGSKITASQYRTKFRRRWDTVCRGINEFTFSVIWRPAYISCIYVCIFNFYRLLTPYCVILQWNWYFFFIVSQATMAFLLSLYSALDIIQLTHRRVQTGAGEWLIFSWESFFFFFFFLPQTRLFTLFHTFCISDVLNFSLTASVLMHLSLQPW